MEKEKDNEIKVRSIYNKRGKTLNELMQEWINEKNFFWTFNDNIKDNKM